MSPCPMSRCPLYMEVHLSPGHTTNTRAARLPKAHTSYTMSYLQIVCSFSKLIILFSECYIDGSACRVDLAQLKLLSCTGMVRDSVSHRQAQAGRAYQNTKHLAMKRVFLLLSLLSVRHSFPEQIQSSHT